MDIEEINQYVETGRMKNIIIDRSCIERYPGYVRETVIIQNFTVQIAFNVYNHEYGGLTLYFKYLGYDTMIPSLENYLFQEITQWENINRTGFYPIIKDPFEIKVSSELLKIDFIDNKLQLPHDYIKKILPQGYWNDLYNKYSH